MRLKYFTYYFFVLLIISSCASQSKIEPVLNTQKYNFRSQILPLQILLPSSDFGRENWIELKEIAPSILYNIKYAGVDNFVHQKVYPCAKCYLRPEVAKALALAQQDLKKQGYGLVVYDCYRPLSAQKKLWNIKPDLNYVADPKKGSMHNRGLAVDLSIVDKNGKELDMGTSFDDFTEKAHSYYNKFSKKILHNRKILTELMHKYGMEPIRTEWWHFSYRKKRYPLARWIWDCD